MDRQEDRPTRDLFVRNLDEALYRQVRAKAVERAVNVGEAINEAMGLWVGKWRRWRTQTRSGHRREGVLRAYWEVENDPISDSYTPQEINAWDLFRLWADAVGPKHPDGLVPIHWFVECQECSIFEFFPFQFRHLRGMPPEDFLTFFTWPIDPVTGERLNWLTLPVVDKLWNPKWADKGGFLQEATGWKPAILQPYAYLPALSSALQRL